MDELELKIAKYIDRAGWFDDDLLIDGRHILNNYNNQHLKQRKFLLEQAKEIIKLVKEYV